MTDDEFARALPGPLTAAGTELIRRVRTQWPDGDLTAEGRRFVNRPDNFWTVKIQPRDGSLAVSVRGTPEHFRTTSLELKGDRPGHSWFKVRAIDDVDEAMGILRRARRKQA